MLGVSKDRLAAATRMAQKQELPYALIADTGGSLIAACGAGGMLGLAKRVSLLVGADGRVARAYARVSPVGHAADVLEDLRKITV